MLAPRNRRLIKRYGRRVRILPFGMLPKRYRNAVTAYHENAGAQLPPPGQKFGIGVVPMGALIDAIMQDDEIEPNFDTWDDYHEWYVSHGQIPDHGRSRWPVVLSLFDEETLEDGWHRLHSYYRAGDETVPVIWYE